MVPDDQVDKAQDVLLTTQLSRCTDASCTIPRADRPSPAPTYHLHSESGHAVCLYTQAQTLWFRPALKSKVTAPVAADIISASDPKLLGPRPGRGRGAFRNQFSIVRMPSAERLLESHIRSVARIKGDKHETFHLNMITYIAEYVDGDGLLDLSRVEARCKRF